MSELPDAQLINWEVVRQFYHRAMVFTWREGVEESGEDIPGLPGWKVVRYQEGDLLFLDIFVETEGAGLGVYLIYHADIPIWNTRWDGEWADFKRALPVLRRALLAVHRAGQFFAGRGRRYVEDGDLIYTNHTFDDEKFHNFSGHERVYDKANPFRSLLAINYRGGRM